jgi:hypothetical protein
MLFAQLTLGVTKSDGGAGTFRGGEPEHLASKKRQRIDFVNIL